MTGGSSHENLTTRGLVILTLIPVTNGHTDFNFKISRISITLPKTSDNHVQSSISVEKDPSFLKFSPTHTQIQLIIRVVATVIGEFQTSSGDESSLDDLSDQGIGLEDILDLPNIPAIKAPYKQMSNFRL